MFHRKAQGTMMPQGSPNLQGDQPHLTFTMRPEENPLDLNNLPDDYTRDGKVVFEEGSSGLGYRAKNGLIEVALIGECMKTGRRKKKSGGKDGKDECGNVYECREASEVVMMRERETETLNRARQLVFNNDNLATQGHLGCHPSYDPTLPFRSVYPPRIFPGSSSMLIPPPPPEPYLHPSPSRLSSYPINNYYIGHVLGSSGSSSQYPQQNLNYHGPQDSNFTCIGAPVGHGGRGVSLSNNREEGLNWGRSHAAGTQQNPSAINRFPDGL
ncbi:hypothetical protein F3Y22_tig00111027pilonHSYRG00442 [Hibiscus syriacus]|uniref:Uncharacterized protein n=1 Tax=Hibiscus syriacus TaxID=106335 RepID=A0A6A2Z4I7_HIBSY|nr:hypothetical protein F3Y22_tig00111027pilonHSYRG00442 [Hibiscus syriacus]